LTILTCYAASIVVIYLNLPGSMLLFTFDTNGGYLLSMRLAWYFYNHQRSTALKLHCITEIMCKASLYDSL